MNSKELYRWECIAEKACFAPRDGAGALTYKDKMWLIGGWNPLDKAYYPKICVNDVWNSADGRNWNLIKPNTFIDNTFNASRDWEGRHCAGYLVLNNRMWIVGGDCNQKHYQNDIWSSSDGKKWSLVNNGDNIPWKNRCLFYTAVHNNYMWVMGGQTMPEFATDNNLEIFYNDIWRSPDGISWEIVKPTGPIWQPRGMIGGSVVFKDRIWIIGGGTYNTPNNPIRKYYNDVWSSTDGINWHCHTISAPWVPRSYHDVAVFDNKIWVLEGCHPNNSNDVWYSDNGKDWNHITNTPWKPRHAASVFVYHNALWMVAGNNMESDVWKLVRTSTC